MRSLDEIRRELSELQHRLDHLPADAFAERIATRDRQNALRAEAARHRAQLPEEPDVIGNELRRLEGELDRILEARGIVAASGSGGGPGGDSGSVAYFQELAWRVDEAQGRAAVEARILQLRRRLAELEGE